MNRILPTDARRVIADHPDLQIAYLNADDAWTLTHALRLAAAVVATDITTMRQVAANLRAGQPVAMFADGEHGARAADRLADAHADTLHRLDAATDLLERSDCLLAFAEPAEVLA